MEKITIDEQNKRRILKYIKQEIGFYGYEEDIALLEQNGQLTEALAKKVFTKIMGDAQRIRTILEPEKDSEFKEQIDEAFSKYDTIPKPEDLEQYGFYDGAYNQMELDEVYANMQIAFEVKEIESKYYRCKDLRNIAGTAINSIDAIDKYQVELKPEAKSELQKIQTELQTLLSDSKTNMQAIQKRIDTYNHYATIIWNEYLTDIHDENNSQYRWMIHNLTKGELEGEFRNQYMSTSLITNNTMGRYGTARYGLIIKPKHIVSASYKDTYTRNTRGDEETLFNIRPPLMLPQEIEEFCIKQTIQENGEMLNYETTPIYSEIVVDEFEIEGVYYISYGEQELAPDYDRAKKVAEERDLPLIERDISKYRKEHGLEPMTERAKRNFCGNILRKCCTGDRALEEMFSKYSKAFIDKHFQELYDKYMQLKENREFSKEDILNLFSEITRGDLHFDKVSQNIDEMYLSLEEIQKAQGEREYGIEDIQDRESLQRRLEKVISDGIFYSADKQDEDKLKKFERIQSIIPQFEEFKSAYLQLRQAGLEDELYQGIDFLTISYDELLEKATTILEEKAKAVDANKKNEEKDVSSDEMKTEENIEQSPKEDKGNIRINQCGEIIREHNSKHVIQDLAGTEEIIKRDKQLKKMQPEKTRPQEESIRDEVGDKNDLENHNMQIQERTEPTVELWMNRFNGWYSAIDRVSQNARNKFIKIKLEILNAIKERSYDRDNKRKKQYNKEY